MRRMLCLFAALFAVNAEAPEPSIIRHWNNFVTETRVWVALEQVYMATPGESPIEAQRQWEKVRAAFREVDVIVRNQ